MKVPWQCYIFTIRIQLDLLIIPLISFIGVIQFTLPCICIIPFAIFIINVNIKKCAGLFNICQFWERKSFLPHQSAIFKKNIIIVIFIACPWQASRGNGGRNWIWIFQNRRFVTLCLHYFVMVIWYNLLDPQISHLLICVWYIY